MIFSENRYALFRIML